MILNIIVRPETTTQPRQKPKTTCGTYYTGIWYRFVAVWFARFGVKLQNYEQWNLNTRATHDIYIWHNLHQSTSAPYDVQCGSISSTSLVKTPGQKKGQPLRALDSIPILQWREHHASTAQQGAYRSDKKATSTNNISHKIKETKKRTLIACGSHSVIQTS